MESIEQIIKNTTEENQSKTDWTKAWSTKYPVLKRYQAEVDILAHEYMDSCERNVSGRK